MIAISLDIDWSPDWIVDAIVNLAERRGVPLTLYCTDPATDRSGNSTPLRGRYSARHELGLHPNFQGVADYDSVWASLFEHYPDAKGFRSHQGCTGFPIVLSGSRRGLTYEATTTVAPVFVPIFKPYSRDLAHFSLVPTIFMDSQAFSWQGFRWSLDDIDPARALVDPTRLFVFCFHPNIVYYDLGSADAYDVMKTYYHAAQPPAANGSKTPEAARKLFCGLIAGYQPSDFATVAEGVAALADHCNGSQLTIRSESRS